MELLIGLVILVVVFGPIVLAVAALSTARTQQRRIDEIERRLSELSRPAHWESPRTAAQPAGVVAPAAPPVEREAAPEVAIEATAAETPTPPEEPREAPARPAWQEPTRPSAIEPPPPPDIVSHVRQFLLGGNTAARVGVIVLFFGVAFLLKYAIDNALLPIELRLIGTALGGVALLLIGWRLRLKRPRYAVVLQASGIGIFYLTVFAALRLYSLIPPIGAFALLVIASILVAALAVLQSARSLAVLGIVGGFLAPVLVSTGGGDHVTLFSYYTALNIGILVVAWYRAWRVLNLIGFFFTLGLGAAWGYASYRPELFVTTELFLVLFFLMYVAIAVLFAFRQTPELRGYVDGGLVFGAPVAAFALQTYLVKPYAYGLAWSAVAAAFFYMVLAWVLFLRSAPKLRTLTEAFLALGVVFATLAIPMAFDGRWTAGAWALEGAAIIWVGVRQQRVLARLFGALLQFGAGLAFLSDVPLATGTLPVLNGFYLGRVLVSLAGIFSAYMLHRLRDGKEYERGVGYALLAWGVAWWYGSGLYEIDRHLTDPYALSSGLLFVAASCTVADYSARRLQWRELGYPALLLLPAMYVWALLTYAVVRHPFAALGFASWPAAFVMYYWLLRRHEQRLGGSGLLNYGHAAGLWLLAIIGAWECYWGVNRLVQGAGTWPLVGWAVVPGLLVIGVTIGSQKLAWPLMRHRQTYLTLGLVPVMVFLFAWSLVVNLSSPGDPWPLPYVPILNPLDLAQVFVLIAVITWFVRARSWMTELARGDGLKLFYMAIAVVLFVWSNGVLVRSLHHWAGVGFSPREIWGSVLVQSAFSIFWAVLGLATVMVATRLRLRIVWLFGAGLLAVVVVKLFLIDLANTGTLARVVSFIAVGMLLLLVGYVSPAPPRTISEDST